MENNKFRQLCGKINYNTYNNIQNISKPIVQPLNSRPDNFNDFLKKEKK